jgi:glycosyltransferase involved in cell wall biosynthesis
MTPRYPSISIIMPIRNEAAFIERSLGAVLAQNYPPDRMEVLVVDGMSDDGTREVIQRAINHRRAILDDRHSIDNNSSLALNRPPSIILLDNPGRIVPAGLNAAIRQAKGEIIVRVDGHCEIAPDYVSQCVKHLLSGEVDGVGGPIETIGTTPVSQSIAMAMSSPFGVGGSAFRTVKNKAMLVDTIAFPAYKRRAFEMAGDFDEELVRNQDDEYNYRLRKLGCKILLAPDVRSRYYCRSSFHSLGRQYFQYGYWKARVMQKHPRQMRVRQFVPLAFVMTLLGGTLLSHFSITFQHLRLVILTIYILAALAAALWAVRGGSWRHLPLLPLAFAIMHLSYGLGFLAGLVKFCNRWGDRQTSVPTLRGVLINVDVESSER